MTIDPNSPEYADISARVQSVINRLDRRGTRDHRVIADLHRKWWTQHQPVPDVGGTPCKQCGDPWPCGVVRGLIVG